MLSQFACFAMEGSHWQLKHMLLNSAGLSLLRSKLGLHVVVDNHTMWEFTEPNVNFVPISCHFRTKFARSSH